MNFADIFMHTDKCNYIFNFVHLIETIAYLFLNDIPLTGSGISKMAKIARFLAPLALGGTLYGVASWRVLVLTVATSCLG